MMFTLSKATSVAAILLMGAAQQVQADSSKKDESYHADYIYGAPTDASEAWIMSRGGRLYDNWYASLDAEKPEATHPAWPASNTKKNGAVTTRCKSCHGWDYRGAEGKYGSGSYQTGIKGVMGYSGKDPSKIAALLRSPPHGYTAEMIPDDQMAYLAAFVSRGTEDMNSIINFETGDVDGDPVRGQAVFQTTCAACHGFDGRALDWGDSDEPGFVGTEANANPWETLHKIRNGHPGVEMISLRAFGMDVAADLLAYTRTLPAK